MTSKPLFKVLQHEDSFAKSKTTEPLSKKEEEEQHQDLKEELGKEGIPKQEAKSTMLGDVVDKGNANGGWDSIDTLQGLTLALKTY